MDYSFSSLFIGTCCVTKAKTKDVRQIVKVTFPNYRKRTVLIQPTTKVTFHGLNWCGGSRSEYRACTVDGKPLPNKVDMNEPAPWVNQYEGAEIDLPVGAVVVKGGHFCGKVATLILYVHPDNMPRLLTD